MRTMAGMPSWMQVPMVGQPEAYSDSPRMAMLTPMVMGDRCLRARAAAGGRRRVCLGEGQARVPVAGLGRRRGSSQRAARGPPRQQGAGAAGAWLMQPRGGRRT
jgi:hypothetical protein